MSDERREGSGASAAIVAVLVLCALVGLVVVGGGAALAFFRLNSMQQMQMLEAQARAELVAAQAEQQRAAIETQSARAAAPEILLEVDAAGSYKLAGKPLEYYDDLKAALLTAHLEKGPDLQVVVSAAMDARFDHVSKAVEAAECAGITRHRILTPSSPPLVD